jgi:glycosyltransferase involved in cell wall biosynthesis
MKILVIAPTPFFSDRGTHIRILEEALALEKLGHQITIATYHIGRDIQGEVKTKIDVRRIRRLLFWYKKLEAGPDWQKIILDLMLIRKVFFLARTQKPDIIHGHLHEGVLIGWIVQKVLWWRKMKLVADFHGSLTKEMVSHEYLHGRILQRIFRWVEKRIDNLGDFALASSRENSEDIKNWRKDGKVETVLDGVNLEYYASAKTKMEWRKELGFPQDKIIVTYTGALVSNKGTAYLFKAMKEILSKREDILFVIGGFPVEGMRKFVQENGLEKKVKIINPLNYFYLPKILLASDIGVDPKDSSTSQASGKILQYMGARLPVACFDRPNNWDYLAEAGEYGSEISGQGLAKAIGFLADNEQERKDKGGLGRERVISYSWDNSAKKIEEIYRSL